MRYTDETWALATKEEQNAEIARCKNPVYMYNTYFKTANMPEITEEQFIDMIALGRLRLFKPRYPHLWPSHALLQREREQVRKEFGL